MNAADVAFVVVTAIVASPGAPAPTPATAPKPTTSTTTTPPTPTPTTPTTPTPTTTSKPARPWEEPSNRCWGVSSSHDDLYEVVDPKDPTVNLRATPNGAILAAVPNHSKVFVTESGEGDWLGVIAQPQKILTGYVESKSLMAGGRGKLYVVGEDGEHVMLRDKPNGKPLEELNFGSRITADVEEKGPWWRVTATVYARQLEGVIHASRLKKLRTLPHDTVCDDDEEDHG